MIEHTCLPDLLRESDASELIPSFSAQTISTAIDELRRRLQSKPAA